MDGSCLSVSVAELRRICEGEEIGVSCVRWMRLQYLFCGSATKLPLMEGGHLLFCLSVVLELKHVDLQRLSVLSHIAQNNSKRLVEARICEAKISRAPSFPVQCRQTFSGYHAKCPRQRILFAGPQK